MSCKRTICWVVGTGCVSEEHRGCYGLRTALMSAVVMWMIQGYAVVLHTPAGCVDGPLIIACSAVFASPGLLQVYNMLLQKTTQTCSCLRHVHARTCAPCLRVSYGAGTAHNVQPVSGRDVGTCKPLLLIPMSAGWLIVVPGLQLQTRMPAGEGRPGSKPTSGACGKVRRWSPAPSTYTRSRTLTGS
jgi:hypothetical protein